MNFPPPHHIRLDRDLVAGNQGLGRTFFLPGSEARARQIAEHFTGLTVHPSPRQINAYLGQIRNGTQVMDVAAVPTGMGCPAMNIVITELIGLGARRLLRVGSAGSLQPTRIRAGSLVIATAAVRDEATSDAYAPREIPAVAHPHWVYALTEAAIALGLAQQTFQGVVHTKDALYGREFPMGPRAAANHAYMATLQAMGVMATEMESSHLFMLASACGTDLAPIGHQQPQPEVMKAGSLLAIIGDEGLFAAEGLAQATELRAIEVALAAALRLYDRETACPPSGHSVA